MTKKNSFFVVGLTGKNASGKGSVAAYLEELGYHFSSLSDILREEIEAQGLEASRDNLIAFGQAIRAEHGEAVLAHRAFEKLSNPLSVVDSFRHPAEVAVFREFKHFILLHVDAPAELRFSRATLRGRNESAIDLAGFIAKEKLESSSNLKAQQLEKTLVEADAVIDNSGTLSALHEQIAETLEKFGFPLRPVC